MKFATHDDWHAWESGGTVILSDESAKQLRSFRSWDDCINWLYLNGHKQAARAIHNRVKS